MNTIEKLMDIIRKICPYTKITSTTELIDSEILTSIDLFLLVSEMEDTFNIHIDEEKILAESFSTPEKIVRVVLGEELD